MTNDRFGVIPSRWTVAEAMADELHAWLPEYLAAEARQSDEDPAKIVLPKRPIVRHTAAVRPTEAAGKPTIVVVLGGVSDRMIDPTDGIVTGTLQLGAYLVVHAKDTYSNGVVLHRLVAATTALFDNRRTLGGLCQDMTCIDEDFTRTTVLSDRVLQSADLTFEAYGVVVGQRGAGPPPGADPRPDPTTPWPTPGVFESAPPWRTQPVTAFDGMFDDPDPTP